MDAAFLVAVLTSIVFSVASSDPQTDLLTRGCSQYNATPANTFVATLNSAFANINASVSLAIFFNFTISSKPQSATAVYALFMCRNYLSTADCKTCFSTAVNRIRSCGTTNGARVVHDGCVLRYEDNNFFDQGTALGATRSCNGNANGVAGSKAEVISMATDLAIAVPKISGYAAAVERNGVYGYTDCAKMAIRSNCQL